MDFMKKAITQIDTKENTLYDFIYNLIFFTELQESKDDMINGRVCTLDELKAEMEAKYESYNNSEG